MRQTRKPTEPYDIDEFSHGEGFHSLAQASHKVDLRTLTATGKTFYCKEMRDPSVARLELLAQELFRLYCPHQPRTKLAVNRKFGTMYLLSESIPGAHTLPEKFNKLCNSNYRNYQGLGQALVVAGYLQEVDLKAAHLLLDQNNHVFKIDGDWSFAGVREAKEFPQTDCPLTPEFLGHLPMPVGYQAFNWFTFRAENRNYPHCKYIDTNLSSNIEFKHEKYCAIHKILLTPDLLFQHMVDACIPAGGQRYLNFLIQRREQLQQAALQMPEFRKYLSTMAAKQTVASHLTTMQTFTLNRDELLFEPRQAQILESLIATQQHHFIFPKKIEEIKEALNLYSPTLSLGLFGHAITLGFTKNRAKENALKLIDSASKYDENLYKQLYNTLFKPFAERDIKQANNQKFTRFHSVLQAFDLSIDEPGCDTYVKAKQNLEASVAHPQPKV